MNNTIQMILLIACAGLFVFTKSAYAYLDPGSGSLMLQMMIGAALGAMFTVKLYWKKLKAFLAGVFKGKNDPSSHE